jgi:Bacterial sugar transferase
MRVDAETDGHPRWASEKDPRITRVGAVIRKLRIDELAQIFNVLRGEMSFVGPVRSGRFLLRNSLRKSNTILSDTGFHRGLPVGRGSIFLTVPQRRTRGPSPQIRRK